MVNFVDAIAAATDDDESRDRRSTATSTAERIRAGRETTGWPTLMELLKGDGKKIVSTVYDWLGGPTTDGRSASAEDWPDPEPLGGELPAVEPFDLRRLPGSFRRPVTDTSKRLSVPADYGAVGSVIGLAATVGRRAYIQPKVRDTRFLARPNLWGYIVAKSGLKKTPQLAESMTPLRTIEAGWGDEYQKNEAEYAWQKEEAEIRHNGWKQQATRAARKDQPLPPRPAEEVIAPVCKRLIVNDATPEKLREILRDNPGGVLLYRDELMGLLAELGKQGRETERQFLLECWNGDGDFKIDRIGRGTILAKHLCVSILGGIQPAQLRTYITEAVEGGQGDDGLMQRFQIAVYPDQPGPDSVRYVDEPPDFAAIEQAEKTYRRLTAMDPDKPRLYRFDEDAQDLFREWLPELDRKVLSSELHPALSSHLAKYRSLMPSLALLFELADGDGAGNRVSLEHAQQAAAFCDYLESHARRIYSVIISPERQAAAELGRHLQEEGWRRKEGVFAVREVYHKGWRGLTTPEAVRNALELLEDAGWVRRLEADRKNGRPTEMYMINPKLAREAQ